MPHLPPTQAAPSTAASKPQDMGGSANYSTEPTSAADSSASPTDHAAAPGTPGKLTPPGTALKLGATATTHSYSGEKGTAKYKEASYDMTVTVIVAGTNADPSKFNDSAKFAGQTPYYVFTKLTLTSLNKPSAGLSDPQVTGLLKDGSEAQKLIVFGAIDDSSFNYPTYGDNKYSDSPIAWGK